MAPIYLVRHARPASGWGSPESDPGLDPEGLRQADATAKTLAELPRAQGPCAIASSPMRRCRQTAQPLADALDLPIAIAPEVGEIPTPAKMTDAARGSWLRGALAGRWRDIVGDRDYEAWREGVLDAVAARPGQAIFTHFVAINAVISHLEGVDDVVAFRPAHASVTVLDWTDGLLTIVRRGDEAATGVL